MLSIHRSASCEPREALISSALSHGARVGQGGLFLGKESGKEDARLFEIFPLTRPLRGAEIRIIASVTEITWSPPEWLFGRSNLARQPLPGSTPASSRHPSP